MLNIVEFNKIVEPLEEITTPLADERNRYFGLLRTFAYDELKLAVEYLMKKYKFSKFPKPAYFFEIIEQIKMKRVEATAEDLLQLQKEECRECNRGLKIKEYIPKGQTRKYFKAVYCDCAAGQRLKKAHKKYFKKRINEIVETSDINVEDLEKTLEEIRDDEIPF